MAIARLIGREARGVQSVVTAHLNRRALSTSAPRASYSDTLKNLIVTADTKVIVQGFTGRQSTFDCEQSIEFGTKIVGGVRPGKEGEHLGRPYYPSVRAAKEALQPDATLVYVAAGGAASAIEEAMEAEIPLIVAVAEHIPLHEMLRVQAMLRSQSKCRLVGANSPGMTSVHVRCRLGFQPLPFFTPGCVSLVAKSGTMSYEAVASTTRAGLGQSYAIGIGGDDLPGTDFVDALQIFEHDANTKGIVLIGEVGGYAEEEAALWIENYRSRTDRPKPIVAVVGGINPVQGRVMGHDGAFQSRGEVSALDKARKLAKAGVHIVDHPSHVGEHMSQLLKPSGRGNQAFVSTQKRSLHTQVRRRPMSVSNRPVCASTSQRSFLHFQSNDALDVLTQFSVPVQRQLDHPIRTFDLFFQVHRAFYSPSILIRRKASSTRPSLQTAVSEAQLVYPLGGDTAAFSEKLNDILQQFSFDSDEERSALADVVISLRELYAQKEAKHMWITLGHASSADLHDTSSFGVVAAELEFDSFAHTIGRRHESLHQQQRVTGDGAVEIELAKDNIVFLRRSNPSALIGTLVNGAGLAMNTVDNLEQKGLPPTNFLDTGGKATADTVAASMRAILADERVQALFVNIFGGLTRAEVIANGILKAYKEVGVKVPVVVRLRGTNEALGRDTLEKGAKEMGVGKIGEGDGPGMTAVEGFDEAVEILKRAVTST